MNTSNNGNRRFQHNPYKGYIVNERIRGDEFRLLDSKGEQVGIVPRAEAFAYAKEHEIDLVLIASKAVPMVVKAIDFHKFLYQEEKKEKESKKGQKKGGTKDIQVRLFIGDGDLKRQEKKAQEFLDDGYQVRIKIPLHGRQLGRVDMAFELIKTIIGTLENVVVSSEPKKQGRVIQAVVVRKK